MGYAYFGKDSQLHMALSIRWLVTIQLLHKRGIFDYKIFSIDWHKEFEIEPKLQQIKMSWNGLWIKTKIKM